MSGISTSIPGTNYQLRGDQFVGQDGTTLTRDQFVDKVRASEISLTSESLKFLDKQLGPDTMNSLRTAGGFLTSPPRALTNKLGAGRDGVEQLALDMYTMLAMLVEDRSG